MIYPKSRFNVAKGYRLQFEEQQGTHVLLYPEGMVELSETAYEVLSLVVEDRTFGEMIETLTGRYEGGDPDMADDVRGFLEEAHAMGWIDIR
jgi:pyrroloquinoline quinone biosynthesis protein D